MTIKKMHIDEQLEAVNLVVANFVKVTDVAIDVIKKSKEELNNLIISSSNDTDSNEIQLSEDVPEVPTDINNAIEERKARIKFLKQQQHDFKKIVNQLEKRIGQFRENILNSEKKLEKAKESIKATKILTSTTFAYQTDPVAGFVAKLGEPQPFELYPSKMTTEEITEYIWKQIGGEVNWLESNK